MILSGNFTMISVVSKVSSKNGQTYYNVNVESEEGLLFSFGATEEVVAKMEKYKKYLGFYKLSSYNGELRLTLVEVQSPAK